MSAHRTAQMFKAASENGFSKETHLIQELLQSADLRPPVANNAPNVEHLTNNALAFELYECKWSQATEKLEIFRLRNLLKKKAVHVASSKSQMSSQLKPIRLKHGTPNPSRAALLKLSIPQ